MKSKQERLLDIARQAVPGLQTLEARNSDSLDFHEIGVWQFREALEKAYRIGREDEKRVQERRMGKQ